LFQDGLGDNEFICTQQLRALFASSPFCVSLIFSLNVGFRILSVGSNYFLRAATFESKSKEPENWVKAGNPT
jgi:hypothetical protein